MLQQLYLHMMKPKFIKSLKLIDKKFEMKFLLIPVELNLLYLFLQNTCMMI